VTQVLLSIGIGMGTDIIAVHICAGPWIQNKRAYSYSVRQFAVKETGRAA
jgi:hypothetical protein